MKLTRMLSKKLTSFWLMSLASVAFVFLFTAVLSFVQLTYEFQQQKVSEIESMLVSHYEHDNTWKLDSWLPPVLIAFKAAEFTLIKDGEPFFEYKDKNAHSNIVTYKKLINKKQNIVMKMTLPEPFTLHHVGWYELLIFGIGIIIIALVVRFGFYWFSVQLDGIEHLAQRSQKILKGEYDKALIEKGLGQPRVINRALTRLLQELEDVSKQRERFDQSIRSNTFLDPETGIGNRIFFDNRLDALTDEQKMTMPGVMYFLEIEDLDLLQQDSSKEKIDEMLSLIILSINQVLSLQVNSLFARRSFNQFALIIPQISQAEADRLASKLLKVCLRQATNVIGERNDFVHLGGAYFNIGEDKAILLEEADMALRAAQFQGTSSWFMYDKGALDRDLSKGSVQWRSFLENALVSKRVFAFSRVVFDNDMLEQHREITCRLRDTQGHLIRATLFLPMAIKCGLTPQIERQIIEIVLFDILPSQRDSGLKFSINLSLDTLTSRAFIRWLTRTLLEYRHLMPQLIFEVNEIIVVNHMDRIKDTLDMIRKMGASLCVDRVGQQVVSAQYIKQCHFDFIKLHKSIVRKIHLREENQLFIRSLMGGLSRNNIVFGAEGVTSLQEWQTLQILGVNVGQGPFFSELIEEDT
ncbi:RNase E specificity factor CsrD [Shewanella surugensis]|uniref:RNase E specificity factor CsrD n=1 Tax=Shewanella surugensis TaxID=212020 RepID=A0ABT0LE00_9GAMM|nr:RNase E specificity factor CsrD [Shewanella surugensis]MCL1125924.1 RNase E specificity factor CsrD [Shewanella surugensis]